LVPAEHTRQIPHFCPKSRQFHPSASACAGGGCEQVGADVPALAAALRKPLRPLWVSQRSRLQAGGPVDAHALAFTPLVLVSASLPDGRQRRVVGATQRRTCAGMHHAGVVLAPVLLVLPCCSARACVPGEHASAAVRCQVRLRLCFWAPWADLAARRPPRATCGRAHGCGVPEAQPMRSKCTNCRGD